MLDPSIVTRVGMNVNCVSSSHRLRRGYDESHGELRFPQLPVPLPELSRVFLDDHGRPGQPDRAEVR